MRGFVILFCAAGALIAPAAGAQKLWNSTSVGMTPNEALAVLEGSVLAPSPWISSDGSLGLVEVPGLRVGNRTLTARLFFLGHSLSTVLLTVDFEQPTSPRWEKAAYGDLLTMLRFRYGPELSTDQTTYSTGTWDEVTDTSATWIIDGITITLDHMPNMTGTPVRIVYNTRLTKGIDAL